MPPSRARVTTLIVLAVAATACRPPDVGRRDPAVRAFLRIVAAEDARPAGGPALDVLIRAEDSPSGPLRAAAVRGLGRLENPSVVARIAPLLGDPRPDVRAEAANALAQAVSRGSGAAVEPLLLRRVEVEADPYVRGVLARSLGRLSLDGDLRQAAEANLLTLSRGSSGEGNAPVGQLVGVGLGMESFVRRSRGRHVSMALIARLRELAREPHSPDDPVRPGRIRELAVLALGATGALGTADIGAALADPVPAVRRAAAARLSNLESGSAQALVDRALGDTSAQVRLEAVRAVARRQAHGAELDASACVRLLDAARGDADPHVRIAALDGLSRPCTERREQTVLLLGLAGALERDAGADWHVPAHALVALAHVDPAAARGLVRTEAVNGISWVRMYAARSAAATGDAATLRTLADDPVPNVRTEAIQGLSTLRGHGADTLLLRVLGEADDPLLILTTAHLLADTPLRSQAATAALSTLDRISKTRQETLRDARLALLDLVETTGDEAVASRLERYLVDYDAAVAERAAAVLQRWTGKSWLAAPRRPKRLPLPTPAELHAMEGATVVLHMARGGDIDIRLLPLVAPTNALRLYHQAMDGTLDGLTFHRVVPNFVIQGGSPDANEYSGHGAFTRDELDIVVQWRGTVGLSTRGRDTGDGQIYINTVDDVRLDHDYTVLGVVTSGMDVVDGVLEGDVIRHAEVR